MSQPEKVFRLGAVSASVFRNESSDKRVFRSVQLQRSYRDGDKTKYSGSMNLSHLPNAIAALQMAFDYLAPLEAEGGGSGE
jgi:hypothetical protein